MYHLVPYLHFNGNAEEVLNFYKDVFDVIVKGKLVAVMRTAN